MELDDASFWNHYMLYKSCWSECLFSLHKVSQHNYFFFPLTCLRGPFQCMSLEIWQFDDGHHSALWSSDQRLIDLIFWQSQKSVSAFDSLSFASQLLFYSFFSFPMIFEYEFKLYRAHLHEVTYHELDWFELSSVRLSSSKQKTVTHRLDLKFCWKIKVNECSFLLLHRGPAHTVGQGFTSCLHLLIFSTLK